MARGLNQHGRVRFRLCELNRSNIEYLCCSQCEKWGIIRFIICTGNTYKMGEMGRIYLSHKYLSEFSISRLSQQMESDRLRQSAQADNLTSKTPPLKFRSWSMGQSDLDLIGRIVSGQVWISATEANCLISAGLIPRSSGRRLVENQRIEKRS